MNTSHAPLQEWIAQGICQYSTVLYTGLWLILYKVLFNIDKAYTKKENQFFWLNHRSRHILMCLIQSQSYVYIIMDTNQKQNYTNKGPIVIGDPLSMHDQIVCVCNHKP